MDQHVKPVTKEGIVARLREHGIQPTVQRVEIAHVLFSRATHLSAEDVFEMINADRPRVSKATVYNTLGLFVRKALIREVIADPSKIFYDPNTMPHHHFYHVDTGELADIHENAVALSGLPELPAGTALEGVDVIVRLRRTG